MACPVKVKTPQGVSLMADGCANDKQHYKKPDEEAGQFEHQVHNKNLLRVYQYIICSKEVV